MGRIDEYADLSICTDWDSDSDGGVMHKWN